MRVPGLKRLRLSARRLRSRFVDGALILGYHCIADVPADPYALSVTPQHFAEHLTMLRQYACPMSLRALVQALQDGKVPRRAVVMTFDDGYADTLYTAKPLLERYDIPATAFIATGYLGREFWWDELERILLAPETLPEALSLTVNGYAYEWRAGDVARNRLTKTAPSPKQRLLQWLYQLVQPLSEAERQRVMEHIRTWANIAGQGQPTRHALSPDEVIDLAKGNLIEIGAHTVTHPLLATLSLALQRSEVLQSKTNLEEIVGYPVTSFSYPHGSLCDETITVVREAGFSCACTSFTDVAWSKSDRLQLPRFWVQNWGGMPFTRWLGRWLTG